jgi:hypothetical protein
MTGAEDSPEPPNGLVVMAITQMGAAASDARTVTEIVSGYACGHVTASYADNHAFHLALRQ